MEAVFAWASDRPAIPSAPHANETSDLVQDRGWFDRPVCEVLLETDIISIREFFESATHCAVFFRFFDLL